MKIKAVPTIIAVLISALVAFGFYSWCRTSDNQWLLAIGSFLCLFVPLMFCVGVSFEGRTTASTIALGGIFFALMLVVNLIFTFIEFGIPAYVIVNGILLLLLILIIYVIAKVKQ